jgi:hypothetical protein
MGNMAAHSHYTRTDRRAALDALEPQRVFDRVQEPPLPETARAPAGEDKLIEAYLSRSFPPYGGYPI